MHGMPEEQDYNDTGNILLTTLFPARVCAKLALLVMMRHEQFSVSVPRG